MSRFVFRFETLLKYRQHRYDLVVTLLGQLMSDDRRLVEQRVELEATRLGQLDEIRELANHATFNIDQAAARRYYAGQISGEIQQVLRQRHVLGEQITQCRQALVKTNQDVKVLEKLEEQQQQEFHTEELRKSGRELEETWFATHAMEYAK
jgi:flagellar export protein FliJ